jgi:hypothetical protein
MTNHAHLVRAALVEVQMLREMNFKGSDHFVVQLMHSYQPKESLADLLWADLPEDTPAQDIADLLSLLSWRTDDNGSSIMHTVESWIDEGASQKQVTVALSLDAYPFVDHNVRVQKIRAVAARFPELLKQCQQIINQSEIWINQETPRNANA